MMSTIRIENRGKNLAIPKIVSTNVFQIGAYTFKDYNNLGTRIKLGYFYSPNTKLYLKFHHQHSINTTEATAVVYLRLFDKTNVKIDSTELTEWDWSSGFLAYYKSVSHIEMEADITVELPKLEYPYSVFLANRAGGGNPWSIFSNIMITEEPDAEFEPPRNDYIEFDTELFAYNGVADELHDDGKLIKKWQRESITITAGAGTITKSGTGTCILVADSDGLPYEGTVSGTSISTSAPDGTYTVIYRLATPEISKIPIHSTMKALGSGHNQFLATKYDKDTFTGDGVTTTFNLSKTANSTNYSVKVNGVEIAEGITKNTTSIVFDTAPRNGAIIEVYYNSEPETLWCAAIEVYEPSGAQETLSQFTELSITENDDVVTAKFDDGTFKKVVKSRDFTVTLNKALIENAENFIQKYRDKKFRMIITNSRDSSVECVAMCEFDTSRSKNYMDGSENITIRCTDLYD